MEDGLGHPPFQRHGTCVGALSVRMGQGLFFEEMGIRVPRINVTRASEIFYQ
jgi:hypothetical protein